MPGPHDSLVKALFANIEDAASALASALPKEIAECIDWASLRPAKFHLVDHKLRELHPDLTFTANLRGHEVVLYVLQEHQSTPEALMPFRVLQYIVLLWGAMLKARPEATRLPAVLPVVLYNGKARWSAPQQLRDLIDLPDDVLKLFENHIPSFRFFLDDLSVTDDETLRARALTTMMRACLVLLKKAPKSTNLLDDFGNWLDVFVEISGAPHGMDALRLLLEYIQVTSDAEPHDILKFARSIGPSAEDAYMTAAEKLTQQVREESLQEGRREGRQEGRQEGQVELLLRQLSLRFGSLPEATAERVQRATDVALARWADRVLTATSLDEVFTEA